jgi:hypothetical protein
MAAPVTAALPSSLDLPGGYTLRWTALSPTDGSVVSGVVISAATILTDTAPVNSDAGNIDTSLPQPEPIWIDQVEPIPAG